MNSVTHLARLLVLPAAPEVVEPDVALDDLIERLRKKARAGSDCREPVDRQREVLRRFWDTSRVETLREARLLAFGLGLPAGPEGGSVLADTSHLDALLHAADGWLANPRWFRRCYQGLLWSYFNHDRSHERESPTLFKNWLKLRDYLQRRASATLDPQTNPDWVHTVQAHPTLFGEAPCTDFVAPLLDGDRTGLEDLCERFGIGESSWFLRDLLEAQVRAATRCDHAGFRAALPAMLALLAGGKAWRDAGLALLLERHAQIPQVPLPGGLCDAVRQAWGCPWKPLDALRWNGIGEAARQLAGDWMKADLLDAFFAIPGGGDGARRAAFWKRYLPSIGAIELVVDAGLGGAPGEGCATLCDKAAGLVTRWVEAGASDVALVLTIGCARLVAWNDPAEPVWAYDLRHAPAPFPFDMGRPVAARVDADNALRHGGRDLTLLHRDGVEGWRQWEQLFEATLKDRFGLRVGAARAAEPGMFIDLSDGALPVGSVPAEVVPPPRWLSASNGEDVHWQTAEAMSVPYSRPDLQVLARVHALQLQDEGGAAGKVRVRGAKIDHRIVLVLRRWGFAEVGAGEWLR